MTGRPRTGGTGRESMRESGERQCETCRHWLGGGYDNCRINLEDECGAGYFEAWEAREDAKAPEDAG